MKEFRMFNSLAEQSQGISIATAYNMGLVKGWEQSLAADAFNIISQQNNRIYSQLSDEFVKSGAGKKMFLYRIVRQLLGQDTRNYPQQIGDCVSFGMKNAMEYLQATEKLLKGDFELFRPIFPPYLYGTGRIYIGNGQMGNEDGSLGSWMADAVIKYGVIPSDEPGVPSYSGSVAKQFGNRGGASYLDKWKPLGQQHLVKSAAKINSWPDLVAAIVNGYPCTVASDQGFTMEANANGFHRASGSWAHQMCIIGVDDEHPTPYALILNSWGDAHGHLQAFDDPNEALPIGVLRVERRAIEGMIRQGETFAISNFDGFPEQALDEALFKIVG